MKQIKNIGLFFLNLWFKYIQHPIQKYIKTKNKIKYDKNIKKQFKKDFNVDHNEVKILINKVNDLKPTLYNLEAHGWLDSYTE